MKIVITRKKMKHLHSRINRCRHADLLEKLDLYVICVPADKVMEYSYPARPGGQFCDCRSEKETFQQLVKANQDVEPKCTSGVATQWRLAATALRPENGVRSFALSPYGDITPFISL